MRKFTKEISALLSTVAVGAVMSASPAPSDDIPVRTAGTAINPDAVIEPDVTTAFIGTYTTTSTTKIGTETTGYTWTYSDRRTGITTTTSAIPPLEGTYVTTMPETIPPLEGTYITTTTTTIPPLMGTFTTTSPTTTTTTIPPLMGTFTTTSATTTETIPPIEGGLTVGDGDINGDGIFNVSDVVVLQKFLLNDAEADLCNCYAADMCTDGEIDVFDLIVMKRELIRKQK